MSHGVKNGSAPSVPQAEEPHKAAAELERLLTIMTALRDPLRGCPWDREQTFASIAPYTVEEAHEVADAIERDDMHDLKDELGDLLLQVVYHARMAEEAGHFAFADVAKAVNEKMIRRHPHVFGDVAEAAPGQWEAIKKAEREAKAARTGESAEPGLFGGIPAGLPALMKSAKLQQRARRTGFDWPSIEPIFEKLAEELAELKVEIAAPAGADKDKRQFEEFGDVMFVIVNLGLHLGIDAESALRAANQKFVGRVESMIAQAEASGREFGAMTLDEMNVLWDRAKEAERKQVPDNTAE